MRTYRDVHNTPISASLGWYWHKGSADYTRPRRNACGAAPSLAGRSSALKLGNWAPGSGAGSGNAPRTVLLVLILTRPPDSDLRAGQRMSFNTFQSF